MASDDSNSFFILENAYAYPGMLHGQVRPTVIGIVKFTGKFPAAVGKLEKPIDEFLNSHLPAIKEVPEKFVSGKLETPVGRRLKWIQKIADVASALQFDSGQPVTRGLALKSSDPDIFHLAVPHFYPGAGADAVKSAVELLGRATDLILDENSEAETFKKVLGLRIEQFRKIYRPRAPVVGTMQLVKRADERRIPWMSLPGDIIQLGQGVRAKRANGTFTDETSNLAARVARNKSLASALLRNAGVPVPMQYVSRDKAGAVKAANQIGYPVVLKPASLDGGVGVYAGLRDDSEVAEAFEKIKKYDPEQLVESHVDGEDYRLLVLNGKFVSAVKRIPGGVTGDGKHTIRELIDIANRDPRRGETKDKLVKLGLDDEATDIIAEQGKTPNSVLEKGEFFPIRRRANISSGGVPESANNQIHEDNCRLAERAARIVGLDIAGVDFLSTDISKSWMENGAAICEINGQPVPRPHWFAESQDRISDLMLDHMFPNGSNGRIPIVAVAGSEGRLIACRMLHRIIVGLGLTSGLTTEGGTWIGKDKVVTEKLPGITGTNMLLMDEQVQSAIVELPFDNMVRFGFPADYFAVFGISNLLGEPGEGEGANSFEAQMAVHAAACDRADRTVVINADDPNSLKVSSKIKPTKKILVSEKDDNPHVRKHVLAGGRGVVICKFKGKLQICQTSSKGYQPIVPASDVKSKQQGKNQHSKFDVVFVTGLALALELPTDAIAKGVTNFTKSPW